MGARKEAATVSVGESLLGGIHCLQGFAWLNEVT